MNQIGNHTQYTKLIMAGTALLMATTLADLASAQAQSHERASPAGAIRVAQADSVTFDIPQQSLQSALTAFAEQSGWQLFYSAQVAEGLRSAGLSGPATAEAALKQLLVGTGLDFRITEPRTVTLVEASSMVSPLARPQEQSQIVPQKPPHGISEAAKAKPVKVPEIVVREMRERDYREDDRITALKEIPGTVNVVTREEIQRARPKSADEMLRRIPGVNIVEEYGQGLRPNISIRGLDPTRSRNVLILVDEIPIQPALFGDNAMYYMVPIDRVDHIEVIKGGATVRYSPNTQGGLINFVTKSVPLIPTFSTTNTFGSFNYFQSDTSYGGQFENLGAQMGYVRRQGDGFRQHGAFKVDDFAIRLESNTSDKTKITSNVSWYQETTQTPGSITPAQYAADRTTAGKPLDEFTGQRGAIDITANHQVDAMNSVKLIVYGNVFERNWYIQDQSATTGALLPTSQNILRKFNVLGVAPQHQMNFSLFGKEHKLTTGVRYHSERETDILALGTPGSKIGRTTKNADLESVAYSAYTEGEFKLTDALSLTPGIRWEQVNQSRETFNPIPPATTPNFKSGATTEGIIYGTGIKYQLPMNTLLFGHVHTTFRPPTFANAVDPTSGADNDLAAERGLSSDIGVRSNLHPGVSAELAVFRMEFSNQIVTQGGKLVNAGKTLHEGIESSLNFEWGQFWKPLEGFASRANVTLLRPKSLTEGTAGKDLPMAPRMTFYGSIGYYHSSGASIELDATYVARQFTDLANTVPENALGSVGAIPSYTLSNLRFNYAPPKSRWAVFVGIRNLFDESFISQRTTASFVGIQPGEIRNFYGGIAMKF